MLSVFFLLYGLLVAKKFTQIGLKEDCLNSANSPFAHLGYLNFVSQVSLKDSAVICVQWCSGTLRCNAAIAFWHETWPACLLSPQRFLGFDQTAPISRFEIPEGVALEQWQNMPKLKMAKLNIDEQLIISQSIRDQKYYAYNVFFPPCPKEHNLYPSRSPEKGLGVVCDINRFESFKDFERAWRTLSKKDDMIFLFWSTFRQAILHSFFLPNGDGFPSLLVGKSMWEKPDIVQMVRRILNKEPLDPSMVYAHAAATFPHYEFFSVFPETITVDEIKQQKGQIHVIHQPFHLPDGNWVILKWEILRSPIVATIGSDLHSVLDIPIVHQFLQKVSTALEIEMPRSVDSFMAYTKCVEGDEAFFAIFLNSLPESEKFSKHFNIQVPDDFRLWISFDFMQRFGLTADDVDTIGLTTTFKGDIDFTFHR